MKDAMMLFSLISMITYAQEFFQPDQIIPYKDINGTPLTLHVFYPPEQMKEASMPAIVFFFGGSWTRGEPAKLYRQSAYLASRGMVAVCADYRTKKSHNTSPKECVQDGKSAMRWVRSHAGTLGIDPNRIAAGGDSAGGHVAAAAALAKGFNEEGEDTSVSSRPNALVLLNPVFDNGPEGYGHDRVQEYWENFSPMHNIDGGAPPTLVMLGTKDKLIPVATAEKYKELMEAAGCRCDLRLYENELHSFWQKSRFVETMLDTDLFLASLGYLKNPASIRDIERFFNLPAE